MARHLNPTPTRVASYREDVALAALEPYLIKAYEKGVESGSLDLDMQSDVRERRLQAQGRLTISGLKLAPAQDSFGTFMGLRRDAMVASLKNTDDKISLNFVLDGDIDDPQLTLNEALSARVAASMPEALGVRLGGLAKGAESLGQKGVEGAGKAAESTVRQIFKGKGEEERSVRFGVWSGELALPRSTQTRV